MSPIRMSKIETAIRVVLAFYDALNREDIPGMMTCISADCSYESANGPDGVVYTGKEEIAQFWRDYLHQHPNLQIKNEDVFGLGFRTIMRWRATWETEIGEKQSRRGVDIFQTENGLICKQYSYVKGRKQFLD